MDSRINLISFVLTILLLATSLSARPDNSFEVVASNQPYSSNETTVNQQDINDFLKHLIDEINELIRDRFDGVEPPSQQSNQNVNDYLNHLIDEINERLQEGGDINDLLKSLIDEINKLLNGGGDHGVQPPTGPLENQISSIRNDKIKNLIDGINKRLKNGDNNYVVSKEEEAPPPTYLCKEDGPCKNKILTCPSQCYAYYGSWGGSWGDGNGGGNWGGSWGGNWGGGNAGGSWGSGGGNWRVVIGINNCKWDCKDKCLAYC